ncbi:MAG TPA: RIP metalloprotease [Chloroflexi bacterium]|nr:RIP metalloprotease [Chloroflexota bacterium]
MDLGGTGLSVLAFFLVIGPLILVHELGHFLVARWHGIRVEEFGIGFPPRMVTLFEQGGTKFTLNWIPLGGFMRPAGEDDPSVEGGLAAASKRARLAVLAAGPIANFLLAFLLLVLMFMLGAPEEQPGASIALVEPGSPAERAGLQPGDIILSADDVPIEQYTDLTHYIFSHVGETVILTVQRGDEMLDLSITPRTEWPEGQGPTGIVVQPVVEIKRHGLFGATWQAIKEFGALLKAFIEVPAAVIREQIPARYLRPISIVGISQLGGQAIGASFDQNAAWPIIQLTAFISLALGVTNLLPLPALDGGRILFVLIEAIRGRRVDPQRETLVHFIGFALLLTAMIFFIYLDIVDPLVRQ